VPIFRQLPTLSLLAIQFVPVFYVVMETISERLRGWKQRKSPLAQNERSDG
jgi:hypothetical protein